MELLETIIALHKGMYGFIYDQVKDNKWLSIFSPFKLASVLLGLLWGINLVILELFVVNAFGLLKNWPLPTISILIVVIINYVYFRQIPNKIGANLAYMGLEKEHQEHLGKLLRFILIADIFLLGVLYR